MFWGETLDYNYRSKVYSLVWNLTFQTTMISKRPKVITQAINLRLN
jgi:dUTPase